MAERVVCLDTSVLVKYLTPEEGEEAATDLVLGALQGEVSLIAPALAWAEVGSVLRKKLRAGLLETAEAQGLWAAFLKLPIEFVDMPALRTRAWEIAGQHGLATLYDAAFLACVEVTAASGIAGCEFWTADSQLLRHLGPRTPAYVRQLGT